MSSTLQYDYLIFLNCKVDYYNHGKKCVDFSNFGNVPTSPHYTMLANGDLSRSCDTT